MRSDAQWLILLTCGAVLVAACSSENRPDSNLYGLSAEPGGKVPNSRSWTHPDLRKIAVRSSREEYTLYNIAGVQLERDGRVYVLDVGNSTVKGFTSEGLYVTTYGAGEGPGPTEIQQVSDLEVWQDSVYLVDNFGRKASVFGKTGDFYRTEQYEHSISEIEWAENATKYLHRGLGVVSSVFLRIVPPSGRAVEVSPPLSRDAHPAVLDGRFFAAEERVIYVPIYLPVLLTFSPKDTTGTLYPTPTCGKVPFPEVKQREKGPPGITALPQTLIQTSPTLIGGTLTVRQGSEVVEENLAFDIYDVSEGPQYIQSARFSLPRNYDYAAYASNTGVLVAAGDTTIHFYEVDRSRE